MVAGLGTGWSLDEYAAAAVRPFEERGQVLEGLIGVCRAVWDPDPVSYDGRLTKIASAVVGPKPRRSIPILLSGSTARARRRLVDHADGWLPVGLGVDELTTQWRQLRTLAAERRRIRPLRSVLRVNVQYRTKAYDGADRHPFQGNADQFAEDLAAHAAIGLDEIFLDLQYGLRDAEELKDVAAEVYASARAAGVLSSCRMPSAPRANRP